MKLNFILKNKKSVFEPPLGDLGVIMHSIYSSFESPRLTSHLLYWTFFAISYGKQKSVEVGVFRREG